MLKLIILLVILGIFLSPVYLFVKLIQRKNKKQKRSSWNGTLTDKEHIEFENDDSPYTKDLYTLYFKTTGGEQVKLNVPEKMYDTWEKGDKAKKAEGAPYPEKVA